MNTIVIIVAVIITLLIQYFITYVAVRKATSKLVELMSDLLAYKILELKKKEIINDLDIEQRQKQKKIEQLEKKLKDGTMLEEEFLKIKSNILAD